MSVLARRGVWGEALGWVEGVSDAEKQQKALNYVLGSGVDRQGDYNDQFGAAVREAGYGEQLDALVEKRTQ